MYARLFAYVCLSQFALCASVPGPVVPKKHPLVVFLRGTEQQDTFTILAMRDEVRKLLKPAGYDVEFRSVTGAEPILGPLIVAEFQGQCSAAAHRDDTLRNFNLATTDISNGRILPFSHVHCPVVSRLLTGDLMEKPLAQRQMLFGRSLGRIVAHEIYHILADEPGHQDHGIAKSHFSARELLDARFSFNEAALDRMSGQQALPLPSD